ncbi:hypothetical protein [Microbacterium immunditiarum]|uniref:HNH endonuclease n=1 Tax=Microbacterium immunditiarum TaxID=337480 RepID=A0A7Y9GKF3_9MICO|nr:hypothetical protein [Microbacterium immunditiarum]NYE18093.1 hypothetical protein [Microbacterium immunditiarum]
MTNRRHRTSAYTDGYLRSVVWFRRRDRWFGCEQRRRGSLGCAACGNPATRRQLELHHVDYTRVTRTGRVWRAGERHDDLVAMHPYCHELLHRLIDRDRVLAEHRDRRSATLLALTHLRLALRTPGGEAEHG